MEKSLFLAFLALALSTFAQSIRCELTQGQQLHYNYLHDSTFTSETKETQLTLVIVDVLTESPVLVGNIGTQALIRISADPSGGTLQWAEPKGFGFVNLLTYDKDLSVLYYVKQYRSVNTMFSYSYAGKCVDFN